LSVAWVVGVKDQRAIYWTVRDWDVGEKTVLGEDVVLLSEAVEVEGDPALRKFPRSATLSFTNPAGHRHADGLKRPAPIWIRVRMESGNRRCGYRLGIGRPGATDQPLVSDPTISAY
jgi:hypothetical protein